MKNQVFQTLGFGQNRRLGPLSGNASSVLNPRPKLQFKKLQTTRGTVEQIFF